MRVEWLHALHAGAPGVGPAAGETLLVLDAAQRLPEAIGYWNALDAGAAPRWRGGIAGQRPAGTLLGLASAATRTIWVDMNAAGHGWSLGGGPGFERGASAGGRQDLLTVLAHEVGHLLGHDHRDDPFDVMAPTLVPGLRGLTERPLAGVWSSGVVGEDRLPKSGDSWDEALASLARPTLGVRRAPAGSSHQPRDYSSPTLSDAWFARMAESSEPLAVSLAEDDDSEPQDKRPENETGDGLDVWSLLYGLD